MGWFVVVHRSQIGVNSVVVIEYTSISYKSVSEIISTAPEGTNIRNRQDLLCILLPDNILI